MIEETWNEKAEREIFIGLDLGELRDFAALCALERIRIGKEDRLEVRTLHRWKNGTKYPDIVRDVVKALQSPLFQRDTRWPSGHVEREFLPRTLVVDRAGVGLPIVELFQKAAPADVPLLAVYVHAGKTVTEPIHGFLNVPKRDLIYASVAAFQTKKLSIASTLAHAPALVEELHNFRRKVSETGRGTYESGRHYDLVFALSLSVWCARRDRQDLEEAWELVDAFKWY